ncbi:hypothetical protein J5X84_03650 [Streptosporangiaceae bacterium NEAU-GS5]|nr:hypothetical protein [Streptosporangiaceae bacterium NEAU-GS5]
MGTVLAGFAALLALVGLVGGVPYALIRLAGPPVPGELLDPDLFTSQVGPETVVSVLIVLVWLAWLQLLLCVIVEVYAGLRRIGMPARVPLSGGSQALANRLVSAVLLLFTATATAIPMVRMAAPPPVIAPQTTALSAAVSSDADRPPMQVREVKKVYVVQPPHGRHHESLWEIAEKCLGDGRRYHEIYHLNQHKEQPDGSRLRMADLIRPGWVLDMPDDARNVHVVPSDESRHTSLAEHPAPPSESDGHTGFIGSAPDKALLPQESPDHRSSGGSHPDRSRSADHRGSSETRKPKVQLPEPALPDRPSDHRSADPTSNPTAEPTADPTADPTVNPRPGVVEGSGLHKGAEAPGRVGASAGAGLDGRSGADVDGRVGAGAVDERAGGKAGSGAGAGAHEGGRQGGRDAGTGVAHDRGRDVGTGVGQDRGREGGREGGGHDGTQGGRGVGAEVGQDRGRDVGAGVGQDRGRGAGTGVGRENAGGAIDAVDAGGLDLVDYLAGVSLAAAGVLVVLGRRRREQLWRRAFGQRVPRPRGDAASAEVALRLGSDAPGSRLLDTALRMLGRLLAEEDRRPPTVYAVHLSKHGLDLWIHPTDRYAPEPWIAADQGQIWRLPAHEGRRLDEQAAADVPAPYPGLVSLGTTDSGRVLIDLEAAQGVIAMTGNQTTAALAALAVELATNRWSDRMLITLVGFGEELVMLAPDRIRVAGSLAEALPAFEAYEADGDVLTGRVHGRADDPAHPPHYLLSAIRPDRDEARRLALLAKGRRIPAGFVIAGDLPHATWTWELTDDGRARLDALGFDVTAQLLPRRHYDAVVDLFRTAHRTDGEPLSVPLSAPVYEDDPVRIEVRILGPVEISPVNPLEEGRAEIAHELVVYLATHREGVHPVVLGGILWPRGVQSVVRDATIARVADWLGFDSRGVHNLRLDESGRLRLGWEVRTDWEAFQALVARGDADSLEHALGLVRGPLLNGRPDNRYAWLAADSLEFDITALVADAAHRLCEIRLSQGNAEAGVAAARAGLLLAGDDESLWRDLLRATHASGDVNRLRAVVDALHRRAASHPYGGGMAPQTESLIDELLPIWRRSAPPELQVRHA